MTGGVARRPTLTLAVASLAGPEASYINGQDLIIDGGLVAAIPAVTPA